jgi:hypothetical protein
MIGDLLEVGDWKLEAGGWRYRERFAYFVLQTIQKT